MAGAVEGNGPLAPTCPLMPGAHAISRQRRNWRAAALRCLTSGLFLSLAWSAAGDPASPFRIEGEALRYVTEDMEDGHVDTLIDLLRNNPGITTLVLDTGGGSVWAGDRMAEVVIDFELDTRVDGECISACVTVLLGGETRSMSRGSRIGFHQLWWGSDDMQRFYESERDIERWVTPFDFAEWLYGDTQAEAFERLSFMVARGVDPGFAIRTLQAPAEELWVPWRAMLLAGGVLTE